MKTRSLAVVVAVLVAAGSARGENDWAGSALAELRAGRPDEALEIAKPHEDVVPGRIVAFAAHAQSYDLSKNARAMARATQLYKGLLDDVTVSDAVLLHQLRRLKGSLLHSYAETLLDQALRRIRTPEQARAVPDVLGAVYPSERRKLYAGLSDWLLAQRARLFNGEPLDDDTRQAFTDAALINALLGTLEVKKPGPGAPQALASPPPRTTRAAGAPPPAPSRMQPPRTNATARECLVLIEEPAIPFIQDRLPDLGNDGVSLLSEICAAKAVRESKAPGFLWSAPCGD